MNAEQDDEIRFEYLGFDGCAFLFRQYGDKIGAFAESGARLREYEYDVNPSKGDLDPTAPIPLRVQGARRQAEKALNAFGRRMGDYQPVARNHHQAP